MNKRTESYFIGPSLRRARDSKGWSQEVFAPVVGMSQSNLSNIESNKQKVSWETIQLIAHKLDLTPEELLDADGGVVVNVYLTSPSFQHDVLVFMLKTWRREV
ncbi:MAG: helix-turn-helix transcriptional regulator [Saprospiraceae bacterium]